MVAEVRALDRRSAGELIRLEARVHRDEEREAWGRVRGLGHRIHFAVRAERPDLVEQSAGEIVVMADRRLRQIGGGDAA